MSKYLKLVTAEYEDKTGRKRHWEYVTRIGNPRIVMIVPQLGDKLVLIREFRVPLNDWEWGFPAGLVDPGESLLNAARRELEEETGLSIKKVNLISPPVYNSAGLTDEAITMFFVEAAGKISLARQEDNERIEVHLIDRNTAIRLLKSRNQKFGAKAWMVLLMFAGAPLA